MREIVGGVLTFAWYSENFRYDFNGYLVRHEGGAIVVDPVEMSDGVLDDIAAERPTRIVLTNRNHFRAAQRVRERTGARVAVHAADAAFVRDKGVTVDDTIAAGDRVGPFTMIDASGKSPGELALYWPERKLLLVGDACVGPEPGRLGLLPERVMDDPAALRRSLARIADSIDIDQVLVADGHSILSGGGSALRTLVESFGPLA